MMLEAEVNGQTSPGFRTGWDFPGCISYPSSFNNEWLSGFGSEFTQRECIAN